MSDLLALSFDSVTAPEITLKEALFDPVVASTSGNPRGWGFGWYPGVDMAGQTLKDPSAGPSDPTAQMLKEWSRFGSTKFICHFRGPAQHRAQSDAQPFLRNFSGRSWIIAHSGTLTGDWRRELPLGEKPVYEPVGRTDTEHVFCWLLNQFHDQGHRTFADVGWGSLLGIFRRINKLGPLNLFLGDGQSLVVYHDQGERQPLYWSRRVPPHIQMPLENATLALNLESHQSHRTFVVFATEPMSADNWVRMAPGQLLVVRRGQIVWDSLEVWDRTGQAGQEAVPPEKNREENSSAQLTQMTFEAAASANDSEQGSAFTAEYTSPAAETQNAGRWRLHWSIWNQLATAGNPFRRLRVVHETRYRYQTPVQASHHVLRLQPVHDVSQTLETFDMRISVDGQTHRFEDVFGNSILELNVDQPFDEFVVRAESLVRVSYLPALDARAPHRREQIPLVWMPWQRQMMLAYLLPPELPETHLMELSDFAMSFAERNDYNLRDTLIDMNRTIFRDFKYLQGATNLETTPYEVLVRRQGVCQDFANLLICMARLINIPARYRVGYVDTLVNPDNTVQSQASHAWAELYLPGAGWIGFDPTNGKLVGQEHIRVACGRNYRDATPTMGALYKGGGGETLEVMVKVTPEE
ncbi:MAG: class II glutamine amidotransferase [Deltaproteobacteria bacterium]|nr:class II glutamine amidotransferase [Deltaproteobacteria bacterium]